MKPASVPTTTPKTIATSTGSFCSRQTAMTDAQSPTIDPTEMSISPVTIIKVMGNATIAVGVIPASAIERLEAVRKYRETLAPQMNVPIRTKRRNTSHRASERRNQSVVWPEVMMRPSLAIAAPVSTRARLARLVLPGGYRKQRSRGALHRQLPPTKDAHPSDNDGRNRLEMEIGRDNGIHRSKASAPEHPDEPAQ